MHEYLRRIKLAMGKGLLDAGSFAYAHVAHDLTCAISVDCECNCDPDITVETAQGPISIQKDGTLVRGNNH